VRTVTRLCLQCGQQFSIQIRKGGGSHQLYCGPKCASRAAHARADVGIRVLGEAVTRPDGMREKLCANCGLLMVYPMRRGGDRKYCSRECGVLARNPPGPADDANWPVCSVPDCGQFVRSRGAGFCEKHYGRLRRNGTLGTVADCSVSETCLHCGKPLTPTPYTRASLKYCSRRCSARHIRGNPLTVPCIMCGNPFVPIKGAETCSAACRAARVNQVNRLFNGGYKKRAEFYGVAYERIDRIEVFMRDRWTCQICGRKTPKRLTGSNLLNAPELDHRIAMAAGGGHTWGNVQCSCRKCNQDKRHVFVLGQMNLFPQVMPDPRLAASWSK
jgi:hypothetical protein